MSTHAANAAPISGYNADLDAVWFDSVASATSTETTDAASAAANDVTLGTVTSSAVYFGMNYVFNELQIQVGTPKTGDGAVAWEYCTVGGSTTCTTWTALSVTDNTSNFSATGSVTFTAPNDWVTNHVVDGVTRYYVRARITNRYDDEGAVAPLGTQISAIGFNLKVRVQNENSGALTGLATSAFTVADCTDTTKFAFREIGSGDYEFALLTQGADVNCNVTVAASGYNQSTAASGNLSTTLTNLTGSPIVMLTPRGGGSAAILHASISVDPVTVPQGGHLIFTLRIGNTGNIAAPDVVVIETLPAGFTFADGEAGSKTITSIALLAPGPDRVISYEVTVGAGVTPGTYTNTALVTSSFSGLKLYAQAPFTVVAGQAATPTPSPSPTPAPTPTNQPEALPQPVSEMAAVTLYRIEGDPRVYAVVNNVRRHIPNPIAFAANGFNWTNVRVLSAADVPAYTDAMLFRAKGDVKVYAIKSGMKSWISTPEAFRAAGHRWEDIVEVPSAELAAYASGDDGTLPPGTAAVLVADAGALNVRNAPALSGTRIGRIFQRESVEILDIADGWYKVRLGSALEGWAFGEYLEAQ